MAKTASKSRKSTKQSRSRRIEVKGPKPTRKTRQDILGLILIALGIFLLISIFDHENGLLSNALTHFNKGLFGWGAYGFPFLIIFSGVMVLLYPDFILAPRFYISLGLIFFTLLCLFTAMNTQLQQDKLADYGYWGYANRLFALGADGELCGGYVSSLAFYPLFPLLDRWGVILICILVTLILAVIWGFSFSATSRRVVERMETTARSKRLQNTHSLYMGDLSSDEDQEETDIHLLEESDFIRKTSKSPSGQVSAPIAEAPVPKEKPVQEPEKPPMEEDAFQRAEESVPAAPVHEEPKEKPVRQKIAPQQIAMENIVVEEPPMEEGAYRIPPMTLLEQGHDNGHDGDTALRARKLEDALHSFGVKANVVGVNCGPAITQFEVQPAPGVKSSSIVSLANDLALNLAAPSIRIEAPIPGKSLIGVEVPNTKTQMVKLRDVIESPDFDRSGSALAFGLGRDIVGKTVIADLGKMPHLLVAGATGSGKSVCINSMLISLLYRSSPQDVRLILIDPKVVEMNVYNDIPHLLIPVVTDPQKAAGALKWAVKEMEDRYQRFAQMKTRDILRYNQLVADDPGLHMPYIVIVIDEMADLMMVAARDVEDSVCRLAQKARAAGMHLVLATQRPSVDVITGVIKANIPSRIAFAVSSQVDSRTILDSAGAERLLGKGDMLYFPNGASRPLRVQGAHVGDEEVERVVEFIRADYGEEAAAYDEEVLNKVENYTIEQEDTEAAENEEGRPLDPLLREAVDVLLDQGQASISMVQRRLRVGYARAARLVDQMELLGIVGPSVGSKPREIIKTRAEIDEILKEDDA